MKKMKKILSLLLAFVLTFGCLSNVVSAETGTRPEDGVTKEQPFETGTGGSEKFRIPCLVTLDDGTLVAACDARWTTYRDGGGLDTIVSYSKDNGATWNYTFANYLGDNGNVHNSSSTAFIDPALTSDGENVYMIADLYPAGIALNGANYWPETGHTGYDANGNLVLAASNDSVNGSSAATARKEAAFNYHLEKNPEENAESYYLLKDADGNTVEGYIIDAYFNIVGEGVNTNLFCGDSPYFPYPTDFLYMTKSSDGGATWSVPKLLDVKKASEQTLLVGPGRGIVTSTGRVVFTAYEFTSGDRNSACIYTDDGGETWERGESVSGWSSEAVVTEADGRLYMFTRHERAYYTSEDWGETWSEQKSTGLSYNDNCQLTAITYSEKIDGKTAILFAAPSNTGSRSAGKIFVGLVQEDGSLSWDYEYSINGNAYYAYSCLTELNDGTIGLLYESADTVITYVNISIEDIADGAAIGDIWLTDDEGNIVTKVDMKSNESIELNVNGLAAGAEVVVESDDADSLDVSYADNKVTITSGTVTGLKQVVVTVKSADGTATLYADITDAENYEIVDLRMGDTKTYTDNTGNYSDDELTGLDTNIATVTMTGEDAKNVEVKVNATLATALANFNGESVDISKCLYTFTKTDGDNNYIISGTTADGNTAYLNYRTASTSGCIGSSNSAVITVAKHGSDATFSLRDNTSSSNGAYLYFHHDQTGKLHFDRNSSAADNCYFELYTPSQAAPADSLINGYVKVNSLDEIVDGGKYLVVTKADANGNNYVMNPSLGTEKYNHVAKVTKEEIVVTELATQLASGTAAFNAGLEKISDSLYTFTKADGDNTYVVSATTADGQTVYLNLERPGDTPNKTSSKNIQVLEGASDGTFKLKDTSASTHLHFWYNNTSKLHFDRCGTSCGAGDSFEIYKQSDAAPADSMIQGYVKVTELTELEDGGKYLIARQADDNNYYVLHPSTGSNYSHVAKVTDQNYVDPTANGSTEIVIEGKNEGSTSVKIGDVTYYINVKNDVKNVTLEVGEYLVIKGKVMQYDTTHSVVSVEDNTDLPPYEAVSTITTGQYLLGNTTHAVINSASTVTGAPQGLGMEFVNFERDGRSAYMWTVTAVAGGYTIQDINGQYININGQNVTLTDTEQVFTIGFRNESTNSFEISANNMYLNNWGGSNNKVAAWSTSDNDWYFYQPAEGVVITASNVGTTDIVIGGTTYKITVVEETACTHADTEIVNAKEATCTETGYTGDEVCTECNETIKVGTEIPVKAHTEETVAGKEATCTETGLTEGKKCSVCDTVLEEQETIPVKAHTEETVAGKEATCTETGLTEGKKCSVCDTVLEEQETIPVKAHTEETVAGKEATCTETGLTEGKKCSVCDTVLEEQETIPVKAHTEETVAGKEATCTETGLTEGKKCSVCDTVLEEQEEIPATGHTYGEWTVVKEATEEETGLKERVCACGEKETEVIPKLEPTTPDEPEKPDTDDEGKEDSVQTGDSTSMMLWLMLMVAACAVLVARKRRIR